MMSSANSRNRTRTPGQYGAALAASIVRHPTQEGRAVTDPDSQEFTVPTTGHLLKYDQQDYMVTSTASHVSLDLDPEGNECHRLDIRIQGVWKEKGYRDPMEGLL